MRIKYKIILVVGIFILFYLILPSLSQYCFNISDDCTFFRTLMNHTRAGMVFGPENSEIDNWTGTADGIYSPTFLDQLDANIPFIQTMVIPPLFIITMMIFWDKRK